MLEGKPFLDPQAEAVHAGVDVDRRRRIAAGRPAMLRPFVDLGHRAEDGTQVECAIDARGAGQQAVQHVDHRITGSGAHPPGFRQMGDEEGAAARLPERRHGPLDADAVGVRLDDRGRVGPGAVAQEPPVRRERIEVDGENPSRLAGGRWDGPSRVLVS